MDKPPKLHATIRVNESPRMSAVAMAEYLVLKADPQATVLHDSRYSQTVIRGAYAAARAAFRTYNIDPRRSTASLNKVKEALGRKAVDPARKPRAQATAQREIELIDLFQLRENALGLRGLPLERAPRFAPLEIHGVALSIQPDFLVRPPTAFVGAAMLRITKTPDPDDCRRESTKERYGEHRRDMARYLVAMMELLLQSQAPTNTKVARDLIFVSDVRLGERIGAGSDQAARIRDIEAGCRQVAAQWENVQPRPSIFAKPDKES